VIHATPACGEAFADSTRLVEHLEETCSPGRPEWTGTHHDPLAEHDARYGEEAAGPPDWAPVRDRWRVPGRLVHDDAELIGQVNLAHRSRFANDDREQPLSVPRFHWYY